MARRGVLRLTAPPAADAMLISMSNWGETSYQIARGVGLAVAFAFGLALERWVPHARLRPAWRTNLGLWALGTLVTAVVCGACGWVVAAWAAGHGLGLLAWLGAGRWIAVGVGILGLDAVSYLWHRANHQVPLLWRFHRVHHADASFHVTTALRFHPGELLLALPVRLAAIVLLGVPPEGVLLFELVFGVANLLEHGNFDLPRRLEPARPTPRSSRPRFTADTTLPMARAQHKLQHRFLDLGPAGQDVPRRRSQPPSRHRTPDESGSRRRG